MNHNTQTIVTLIHYNVAVRDTLEYCLQKNVYDVKAFEAKKNTLLTEVNNNTPLKAILDNSGDNGKKMEDSIRAMVEEVYGDKSTICKVSGDNLVVDHAQHLAIFAHALPIHDNVTSMIRGVIADGEQKAAAAKTDEEKAALSMEDAKKLWLAEDRMFRAVAYLTLVNELNKALQRLQHRPQRSPRRKHPGFELHRPRHPKGHRLHRRRPQQRDRDRSHLQEHGR